MPKLLIAVVHAQDAGQLVEALRGAELRVTEVLSRGGFLQARNAMLYIGVEDDQVDGAMHLIEENCKSHTESVTAGPMISRPFPTGVRKWPLPSTRSHWYR